MTSFHRGAAEKDFGWGKTKHLLPLDAETQRRESIIWAKHEVPFAMQGVENRSLTSNPNFSRATGTVRSGFRVMSPEPMIATCC